MPLPSPPLPRTWGRSREGMRVNGAATGRGGGGGTRLDSTKGLEHGLPRTHSWDTLSSPLGGGPAAGPCPSLPGAVHRTQASQLRPGPCRGIPVPRKTSVSLQRLQDSELFPRLPHSRTKGVPSPRRWGSHCSSLWGWAPRVCMGPGAFGLWQPCPLPPPSPWSL